jgi:hypothetical protein
MKKPVTYINGFMFESFDQYAEIMNITRAHPYYEAFQIVWGMARSPSFADDEYESCTSNNVSVNSNE